MGLIPNKRIECFIAKDEISFAFDSLVIDSVSRTGANFTHLNDTSSVIKSFKCSGSLVHSLKPDNHLGNPVVSSDTKTPEVSGFSETKRKTAFLDSLTYFTTKGSPLESANLSISLKKESTSFLISFKAAGK